MIALLLFMLKKALVVDDKFGLSVCVIGHSHELKEVLLSVISTAQLPAFVS